VRRKPDRFPTHLPALNPLAVEPGHSAAQKADGCGLLFVCEHLDVGHAGGVINGHVDTLVPNTRGAALLAVAGDAVTDLSEAGELFDVDMYQLYGAFPLVELDRELGFQVSQPTQP